MDGAVDRVVGEVGECSGEKLGELCRGHLATCHRELAVFCLASAAHMTVDFDVKRGVAEDHPRFFALHQHRDNPRVECVAANKSMPSKLPNISDLTAL